MCGVTGHLKCRGFKLETFLPIELSVVLVEEVLHHTYDYQTCASRVCFLGDRIEIWGRMQAGKRDSLENGGCAPRPRRVWSAEEIHAHHGGEQYHYTVSHTLTILRR